MIRDEGVEMGNRVMGDGWWRTGHGKKERGKRKEVLGREDLGEI